ncbi:ethylene-responsive-like protein [Corchorus olitorius]|uniref:Ethylene-responsive-like protein n=1 Tax=Corchorus olitorius TaxID=93759 RepID=A0A1R3H4P5_9ROSI|nr:ethylene-responsive-like protein [Corchorus olitorius]
MAVENREHGAGTESILENVWANFIGGEEANKATKSSESWQELPSLDGRDGSMELLERLPSLGRWISMGADAWENLLDEIFLPSAGDIIEPSNVAKAMDPAFTNNRKRGSRDWEENNEVVMVEEPTPKRMATVEEYDVVEFQDLGSDYLESLLSSF